MAINLTNSIEFSSGKSLKVSEQEKIEIEFEGKTYLFLLDTHQVLVMVGEEESQEIRKKFTQEIYEVLVQESSGEKNKHLELARETRNMDLYELLNADLENDSIFDSGVENLEPVISEVAEVTDSISQSSSEPKDRKMRKIDIEYNGIGYLFNLEDHGISDQYSMKPHSGLEHRIRQANTSRIYEELEGLPIKEKQIHAGLANDKKHLELAHSLAQDCLDSNPKDPVACSTIISVLRKSNRSQEAIQFWENYKSGGGRDTAVILTTLGAAYLDLGDGLEADRCARRAYGMSGGRASGPLQNLFNAINKWKRENGH